MQADRRPTVTDEVIAINDDLEINYGVFKNDFTFRRPANSWRLWPMLDFVPPRFNATIAEMHEAGVAWTLCEHVSICINGSAEYVFEGPDGPITQIWTPGCHNVENGGGYDALITVISTATPALSWQRSIGSTAYDYGYGVAFDSGNNIYWVANINGAPSLLKISSGAAVQWQLALPTTYGTDGSVQLDPSGNVWVLSGGFGTAAIYKFDSAGSLLLARSVVLDTTTNYANSFGFGGLAVTSAFIVFPFYSALDFSPYGYTDICGAIVKVPPDGSKTGTWSVPGNGSIQGVTYSAWSPSIGASYWGLTYRAFSFVARTLTGGIPGYAASAVSYSNTATNI